MRKVWAGVIFFGVIFFLPAGGTLPARADGMAGSRPYGSDYLTYAEELRTRGAIGFYDRTEDIVRTGNFERAFTRYVFLRANIRGQSLYTGLAASVDQRLQFLKEQMHLGEGALKYEHRETYTAQKRRVKPACPPSPKKTAKPKEPRPEENPPETVIPGQSLEEKAQAAPPAKEGTTAAGSEAKAPAQETQGAAQETKPSGEAARKPAEGSQQAAPAPAPGFWEKFKRKLKFW